MRVAIRPSKARGEVKAPPSKSMAHRLLICAALSEGTSHIYNVAYSEDILATIDCIRALGAEVEINADTVTVHGFGGKKTGHPTEFYCRESGSTLRFFIGIALAVGCESTFFGSERLLARPLTIYEEICSKQGIEYSSGECIHIKGSMKPDTFELAGNISSQFISGLLFGLPLLHADSRIVFTTNIESASYLDLTTEALKKYGVEVKWEDEKTLYIPGGQQYVSCDVTVEGDYSNAAFLDVFNTMGSDVKVTGLDIESKQGDRVYKKLFEELKSSKARIDISDCPDLGPVLMVVATLCHGAEFVGTKRLKIKESDRGRVMCDLLKAFGITTVYEDDRIIVNSGNLMRPAEPVDGCNDHRIVMAAATLLSVTGGEIEGAQAVRKSFPDYFDLIKGLGIEVEAYGMDQ